MATADGGAAAAKRMAERAKRVRDMSRPLKVFGAEIVKATDDSFRNSRGVDGAPWPKLAESTIIARHLRRKGGRPKGFSRKRGGRLTESARDTRAKAISSGAGIKPLVDTGRMRNSQNTKVTGRNTLVWSAVGYMGPHITGSTKRPGRPPMRNPTVFEGTGANARLKPQFGERLTKLLTTWVETGAVA